jgi:hypothetical protein
MCRPRAFRTACRGGRFRSHGFKRHAGPPGVDRGLCVAPPAPAFTTATVPRHPRPPFRVLTQRRSLVDALRRQQQRILHRSALIDYVLANEKRSGDPLTMGDALAELLADITEAARTIGTLLQTTNGS